MKLTAEILLGAGSLLTLIAAAVLFLEVMLAVTDRHREHADEGERLPLAVLVPAHDEASVIGATLASIVPQLTRRDRLLVIADNCSDATPAIASVAGAEVIVRAELLRRGKGYALDFGVRHLESTPPDIVVVIDADCDVAPGSIDRLARACARTKRPMQALYLMRAPSGGGVRAQVAQFAWLVKNRVRPLGLQRLRLPCQLMGTGMAFPWECISEAKLASGHLVEDVQLGIDLARSGTPPLFCPEAVVTSEFPTSATGARLQSTRWEHGHLRVIVSEVPRLLLESIAAFDPDLGAMALDLSVPPLALLSLLIAALCAGAALLSLFTGSVLPLASASAAAMLLAVSVAMAWARFGRSTVSLRSLTFFPLYLIGKIPLYARFLVARQAEWIRSKRDER